MAVIRRACSDRCASSLLHLAHPTHRAVSTGITHEAISSAAFLARRGKGEEKEKGGSEREREMEMEREREREKKKKKQIVGKYYSSANRKEADKAFRFVLARDKKDVPRSLDAKVSAGPDAAVT